MENDLNYEDYMYILNHIDNDKIKAKIKFLTEPNKQAIDEINKEFKDRIIAIYKDPLIQKYYVAIYYNEDDCCSQFTKKAVDICHKYYPVDIETVDIAVGEKPWMYSNLIYISGMKDLSKQY